MFFVVDVETSGLTPWTGQLLTVGIVPVTEFGEIREEDTRYWKLAHFARDPRLIEEHHLTDTNKFWLEQQEDVIDEAFSFRNGDRIKNWDFRKELNDYVNEVEPNKSKRFIAANPVAFDKMWLESAYNEFYDKEWPFHYRCLCIRSLRYGLEFEETEYGSAPGAQKSEIPHHAMYDALAEAVDLSYLLKLKASYLEEILSR